MLSPDIKTKQKRKVSICLLVRTQFKKVSIWWENRYLKNVYTQTQAKRNIGCGWEACILCTKFFFEMKVENELKFVFFVVRKMPIKTSGYRNNFTIFSHGNFICFMAIFLCQEEPFKAILHFPYLWIIPNKRWVMNVFMYYERERWNKYHWTFYFF